MLLQGGTDQSADLFFFEWEAQYEVLDTGPEWSLEAVPSGVHGPGYRLLSARLLVPRYRRQLLFESLSVGGYWPGDTRQICLAKGNPAK